MPFRLFLALLLAAPLAASAQPATDTVRAGQFDSGKMWTFENPPQAYFQEAYGLDLDDAWFEQARLSALRVPGCSASFVSPHGLVMTNHHCARGSVSGVSREGERLLDDGFYAETLDEERRIPGYYADQLVALVDVTDEVDAALADAQTDAERAAARQEAIQGVEARLGAEYGGEDEGIVVQVISLYYGGQYSAYVFKRYDDVRLVMAPELQLGYFGGDADNFTYPRYALDMSYYRIYEDGEPLETADHYFPFTDEGVEEGDVVFVIGNPGSTSRLLTISQFEWRRDVQDPYVLNLLDSRVAALQAYYQAYPEEAERLGFRNQIFGLLNAQKLYRGRVKALRDSTVYARRADTERQFRGAVMEDPELRDRYADLFDRMADIQAQRRELEGEYGAFLALTSGNLASTTLRRALAAYDLLNASGEQADQLRERVLGAPDQPTALQRELLTARLRDLERYLGAENDVVQAVLQGRAPEVVAEAVIAGTVLADSAATAEALEAGTLTMNDPAMQLAEALLPTYQAYQSAFAGLGEQEQTLGAQLGRARFGVYGTDVPPDATFSLRIADGVVQGYAYNGTLAPPHTTFYGLYDHYYSYGPDTEWDLPARWLPVPDELDLETPMNFVSTADIIGGNSGSPVINPDREVVGLVFDGNIESLGGDYIYTTEVARSVSVDARGMVEAMQAVYDAARLVLELRAGELVPTDAEAERRLSGTE